MGIKRRFSDITSSWTASHSLGDRATKQITQHTATPSNTDSPDEYSDKPHINTPPAEGPTYPVTTTNTLCHVRSLPDLHELRQLPYFAPLSHRNLREMDNPKYPITPTGSTSSSRCSDRQDASPSKSSLYADSREPGTRLGWINITGEDAGREEFRRLSNFRERVMSIISVGRDSAMKPESAQRFQLDLDRMRLRNETTTSGRLMKYVIKDYRGVRVEGGVEERAFYDDLRISGSRLGS